MASKPSRSGAPKKARWTASQKAEARKAGKAPKKAHHRGQPDGPGPKKARAAGSGDEPRVKKPRAERSARWSDDDPRRAKTRPTKRFERDDRPGRDSSSGQDSSGGERSTRRFATSRPEGRRSWSERDERPRRVERDERPRRVERDDRPRRFDTPRRDPSSGQDSSGGERPTRRFATSRPEGRRSWGERDERPRREPRVADPVRRDRHEGRHLADDLHHQDPHRTFAEAEAERAAADEWTAYRSRTRTGPASVTDDNGFAALDLPAVLVERLARDGITQPFPIQQVTIPDALAGRDVLGRGRTGSGKTLAFGLPTITRLADGTKREPKRPRALILVPTRELAMQVSDALEPLVHVAGLRHKLVAGGLSYDKQIDALAKGIDILVATPGRLVDLMDRGAVELGSVVITILDEADHMADMGFVDEMTSILEAIPEGGQRLLFSATLDRGVDTLVEKYLTDPVTHSTDDAQAAVTTMSHHVLLIDPQDKKAITAEVANRPGPTIVFVRTQLGADRIARELRERGVLAAALHGGLSQAVRNRVLGAFRESRLPVLVATDVAARGIHVDDVGLVLQVDPPRDHKDYLHRSGRTARAGESGAVVTLALPHQKRMMQRLLDQAGVETDPVKVRPGDAHVLATGGSAPSGTPVPDELWRPILEGGPKQRRPHRSGPPRPRAGHGRGSDHGSRNGRRDERRGRAQWKGER